mgnify:CR=1 FL=1
MLRLREFLSSSTSKDTKSRFFRGNQFVSAYSLSVETTLMQSICSSEIALGKARGTNSTTCQLWWTQINCAEHDQMTTQLLTDIHSVGGNLGLWRHDGKLIETPDILADVFTAKLWKTAAALRDGALVPFDPTRN